MKQVMNRFCCDNCNKASKLMEEKHKFHSGFPYEDKWIYLYALSIKIRKDTQLSFSDKHFCSIECAKKFIMKDMFEMLEGKNELN